MSVVEDIYWDPFDVDIDTDPYAIWRRMRDEAPAYRNERYDFWALSRFDDVLAASKDRVKLAHEDTQLAFYAALIGYLWAVLAHRPAFVVVEPQSADCWFQSNQAGKPALASGDAETAMGGLACREISPLTWPVLGLGTDWFMTIEEDQVMPARRLFAHPLEDDPPIVSGPSGCAGLAGLTRVCTDEEAFKGLHLDKRSRVLLINSEGNLGEGSA